MYVLRADFLHLMGDDYSVHGPFGGDSAQHVEHGRYAIDQREVYAYRSIRHREASVADRDVVCMPGGCEKLADAGVQYAALLHPSLPSPSPDRCMPISL